MEDLVKTSKRTLTGVDGHIQHLKSEHGLNLSKENNVFKLEYLHENSGKIILNKELQALMNIDIDAVKNKCILKTEDSTGNTKWYSIGIYAPKKDNSEITCLSENSNFTEKLLDKKVDEIVDFGAGFKVLSIKKYLSE